jgi:hypothetical protein
MISSTMQDAPSWLGKLQDDKKCLAELGLRPLDAEERDQTRELWRSTWNQVPFSEAFHEVCAERLERCVPLFEGPLRHRRIGKAGSRLVVVHDPIQPGSAWLSLSHALPPLGWAFGGTTLEELSSAVACYTPADAPPALALPRRARIVKQMELSSMDVIKSSIEGLELWVDDAAWGSAFLDDPWQSLEPDAGMMMLSLHMRRVLEQHPGRRPSLSFRTLWSRSIITVEQHPFNFWVFDLRYRPCSDRRAIELLAGDEPGARLPPDLPVDVAASLLRGNSTTRESIELNELDPFHLAALVAIDPGEATTTEMLRRAMVEWDGQDRINGLLEILGAYGLSALQFEVAASTKDERLREALREHLAPASVEVAS